ncbi:DUF6086 family protein [Streptomyces clavuligerus]|uniref:DUF6086 family protein n=1 Tax=Streptomyces clavuligerus TaxID=1901 RepID=UPI00020D932A|nr:DUF6086 family protein [Streptomyces clavuligerus]AXU11449.1 hypothetical protein D1794_01165 [Streptomyces clavuligerus]MBY6301267.1 hypothetical protein [Streptomyces clavuligerus]QCS04321.1 hypothetical protein CRV15_01165 [Streptomyces clavuligerus]QPJ96291.1 hypothetical protein GE265_26705 [Streptomyces clavuligerus]QPL61578.1 hypothetical protein I3J04_01060 [Streptomyces clavuligerus]
MPTPTPSVPDAFRLFADALPERHRARGHAIPAAPSEGFTATVLVLAERAGAAAGPGQAAGPSGGGERTTALRLRARELSRSLPR